MKFQPSKDQELIIASKESISILCGPGTGKSATALEIARSESLNLKEKRNVLFISYSNAAIKRLSQSAGIAIESLGNLRFMTYHSLAWDIIKSYSRFSKLTTKVGVMDEVERSILQAEGYPVSRDSSYEELLDTAKKTGKIGFDIMLPLASSILDRIPLVRGIESSRFPLIIADEFQDTNEEQWKLLRQIGEGSRIIVLGDLNQVIYKDTYEASKRRIEDFVAWKKAETRSFSHKSFRCTSEEILNFSDCLIEKKKFTPNNSKQVQIISCYRNQFRAQVAALCLQIIKKSGNKRIGILTTTAAKAQKLAIDLKIPPENGSVSVPIRARIPLSEASKDAFRCACIALLDYKNKKTSESLKASAQSLIALRVSFSARSKITSNEISKLIKDIGEPPKRRNSKKPLYNLVTILPAMSLVEFEKYFLEALNEMQNYKSIVYQISSIGYSLIDPTMTLSSQMEFPLDHFRKTREPRGLYGNYAPQSKIEILSMWKSKGREFDYVIITMDIRDLPLAMSADTERRLLYVGATRAKEWLGIIYPTGSPGRALAAVL